MNVHTVRRERLLAELPQQMTTMGHVVRRWRAHVVSITNRELAERCVVAPATVSQWESGSRQLDRSLLPVLATAFGESGAGFAQIARCVGTIGAYDARRRWEHNYPEGADSVFAWIRGPAGTALDVRVRWGLVEATVTMPHLTDGFFMTTNAGVNNPRVVVDLEPAGWVDFLVGEPPGPTSGVPAIDAVRLLRPRRRRTAMSKLWLAHVGFSLRSRSYSLAKQLGINSEDDLRSVQAFVEEGPEANVERQDPVEVDLGRTYISSAALRRARRASGFSQEELAAEIGVLLGRQVSQDVVSALERGGASRIRLIHAAADSVLAADGYLASAGYREFTSGRASVDFPRWWVGPIWVEVEEPCLLTLTWPPYVKRVNAPPGGAVFYTRCADPAKTLSMTVSPTKTLVRVGIGRRSGSIDINDEWLPSSAESLRELLVWGERLVGRLLRRRPDGDLSGR